MKVFTRGAPPPFLFKVFGGVVSHIQSPLGGVAERVQLTQNQVEKVHTTCTCILPPSLGNRPQRSPLSAEVNM